MITNARLPWLLAAFLIGCGGGSSNAPETTPTTASATPAAEAEPEPSSETPTETETESDADADSEPVAEPAPVAVRTPRPEPFFPESAEEIHQALVEATREQSALVRWIDPAYGVGSYDPSDTGVHHHCGQDDFTTHPGLAFHVQEEDRFRCNRERTRCTAADGNRGGYAFHIRYREDGAAFLDTIVHYARAVPGRDSGAVRAFVEAGAGVCAFERALIDEQADPPARFSVFVAHHTGLVPDTVDDHLCGDDAAAAFEQRAVPALSGSHTLVCTRNPARCGYQRGDEELTFYGKDGAPAAIAITRPGMFQNLERAQQRDLATFLRQMSSHSCEE